MSRIAQYQLEWYRHARIGALIRALGRRTAVCRRADRNRLRVWSMLGRSF